MTGAAAVNSITAVNTHGRCPAAHWAGVRRVAGPGLAARGSAWPNPAGRFRTATGDVTAATPGTTLPDMDGKVSGVILIAAFLLAAGMCAILALKLWRAGSAG